MGYALMVFSSSTTASRLKRTATRNGMTDVDIVQTPKMISMNGCSYSVRTKLSNLSALKQLAQEYGLQSAGIYRETIGIDGRKSYEMM